MEASAKWFDDQPFSIGPAVHGSYIAAVCLREYEHAASIARRGLRANPNAVMLKNNLAFVLASSGAIADANKVFAGISGQPADVATSIVLRATEGLLAFRSNDPERGRTLYLEAMESARSNSMKKLRAMAAVFLAREELEAGSSLALPAWEKALDLAQGIEDLNVQVAVDGVAEQFKALPESVRRRKLARAWR
jgi:Tfp pilus assembly protein PilF